MFARTLLPRLAVPSIARGFSASARSNIAKTTLVGRLGADPEFTTTNSGVELSRYVVGSEHRQGGESKTQWIKVTAFGDSNRPYLETIKKGALVYVEGDLQLSSYENEEGKKNYSVQVIQRYLKVIKRPTSSASGEEEAEAAMETGA